MREDGGLLMLRLSGPEEDADEVVEFDVRLAKVGSHRYASLLFRNPDAPEPGEAPPAVLCDLWRYEVRSRNHVDVYFNCVNS